MKLVTAGDAKGINLMGVEYVCDDAGVINVPDEHAPVALASGFKLPPADEASQA